MLDTITSRPEEGGWQVRDHIAPADGLPSHTKHHNDSDSDSDSDDDNDDYSDNDDPPLRYMNTHGVAGNAK